MLRKRPSFSVNPTVDRPHCRWPHGWSTRRRATKVGIKSCPTLKNAALPRHALVTLVAAAVVASVAGAVNVAVVSAVCVKAVHAAMFGIWLVSVKYVPVGPA